MSLASAIKTVRDGLTVSPPKEESMRQKIIKMLETVFSAYFMTRLKAVIIVPVKLMSIASPKSVQILLINVLPKVFIGFASIPIATQIGELNYSWERNTGAPTEVHSERQTQELGAMPVHLMLNKEVRVVTDPA